MIATGDDIHAGGKHLPGGGGRDAVAAGGVFAVGDDKIKRVLLSQSGNKFPDRAAARLPHDVANEEQFHDTTLTAHK